MKIKTDLSANQVRDLFHYDPLTGHLVRKVTVGTTAREGDIAGSLAKSGYLTIRINRSLYLAHRLIWLHVFGRWPSSLIDHINGDQADNRLSNLREAEHFENHGNTTKNKNNSSGIKGVGWAKHRNKWEAYITIGGKKKYLGRFVSIDDAAAAYQDAAIMHFGQFARSE